MQPGFFPPGSTVVALDTNVVRDLGYGPEPSWVQEFATLSTGSFSFSLADLAAGEIVNQIERGSFAPGNLVTAISRTAKFINPTLPVLPGGKDLRWLSEIYDNFQPSTNIADYSRAIWAKLAQTRDFSDLQKPVRFRSGTDEFEVGAIPGVADSEFEAERDDWSESIKGFDAIPKDTLDSQKRAYLLEGLKRQVDSLTRSDPPASKKYDLAFALRIERMVQRNRTVGEYNPDSKKRKNDGLDFHLYFNLALPAYLITSDGGVATFVRSLASFQREWVMTPDEFVVRQRAGTLPALTFA